MTVVVKCSLGHWYLQAIPLGKPAQLEVARSRYYGKLADHFLKQLSPRSIGRMLEAGCGKGQLTIPLLERLPARIRLIALDSSTGPYKGSWEILQARLRQNGQEHRVRLVRSDTRHIRGVGKGSVDAVISNELLSDLKSEAAIARAFKEFHRILRPGGVMVHGEWMSEPGNKAQALTIRADSSEGTDTPGRFWNPDELSALMRAANFHRVSVSYFQTTMSIGYQAAVAELRNWGVRESFLKRNNRLLKRYGIELPFEHVIRCEKQSS